MNGSIYLDEFCFYNTSSSQGPCFQSQFVAVVDIEKDYWLGGFDLENVGGMIGIGVDSQQ